MKKIVLFLSVPLMLMATSASVFTPEKPVATVATKSLTFNLAIKCSLSSLSKNATIIPVYLQNVNIPVVKAVSTTVTAGNIDVSIVGGANLTSLFTHTIPAGTSVDATYSIPLPSGFKWPSDMSKFWIVVNPLQNGMEIDISDITNSITLN